MNGTIPLCMCGSYDVLIAVYMPNPVIDWNGKTSLVSQCIPISRVAATA